MQPSKPPKKRGVRFSRRNLWVTVLILLAVYISLFLASWICGEIDYRRVKAGDSPRFARYYATYLDGGTTEYHGLFYIVKEHHELTTEWTDNGSLLIEVGPSINYTYDMIWPLLGNLRRERKETHLEP